MLYRGAEDDSTLVNDLLVVINRFPETTLSTRLVSSLFLELLNYDWFGLETSLASQEEK